MRLSSVFFLIATLTTLRVAAEEAAKAPGYIPYGMDQGLPLFSAQRVAKMGFPLAYPVGKGEDFNEWRGRARAKFIECLLTPPPVGDFSVETIGRETREGYEARKILLSVSNYARIPAYLLVPAGKGPFPAVLALHDHGAHFSIGKEKVVRPFGVSKEVLEDAEQWTGSAYGGRFIGDELARRGYVVLATDALFWGERGRKEGVEYTAQEQLSANLLHLGMTWAGNITFDDMRCADFLATLPGVDAKRIAAMGLSMGSHRTWMLSAATDRIAAGVAICWMGDTESLTAPGNNQTKGQSAHAMMVPNLRNYLDYPDVATIACPKPMLFFNGEKDTLFPVPGVKAAYAKMRAVWESQGAGDKLVTKLWPVPHEFNQEMQAEAFAWLDRVFGMGAVSGR